MMVKLLWIQRKPSAEVFLNSFTREHHGCSSVQIQDSDQSESFPHLICPSEGDPADPLLLSVCSLSLNREDQFEQKILRSQQELGV